MTIDSSFPGEPGPSRVGIIVARAVVAVLLGAGALIGGLLVFDAVSPMLGGLLVTVGFVVGATHLVLGLLRRTKLRCWVLGICIGLMLVPAVFFGLAAVNLILHGWSASESRHGESAALIS